MKDHITVCIATYRRNRMLERLLQSIAIQETRGLFEISIVVVDNDIKGRAKESVLKIKKEVAIEIEYDIEVEHTIPAARNHALRLARGNYIAIVDDDEFTPAEWLMTLYGAIHTFGVDGALGPVYPFFEEAPPDWLMKSRCCERPVFRTGTLLRWDQTRTGNVLLRREVFEKHNLLFDCNFKTGGSDREFFKCAMQLGCRFVAVHEAPVYEIVPPERWRKRYYLKRALVNGFNSHKNTRNQRKGVSKITSPIKSIIAILCYAAAIPFCACIGSHFLINCLERGCHHMSHLFATFGIELVKKRDF